MDPFPVGVKSEHLYCVYTRRSYLGPHELTYSTVLEARVYTESDIRARTRSMGLRTRLDSALIERGHDLIDHVRHHGALEIENAEGCSSVRCVRLS